MKTAVIISGQMRTFAQCYPNQKYTVFRKLEDPHFFVSCEDNEQADSAELLKKDYKHVHIERVKPPELQCPDMAYTLHAPYAITPTKIPGVPPLLGIMRQLWHLSRAWKFAAEVTDGWKEFDQSDDAIMRLRPDLHFHRFDTVMLDSVYQALTPWWGTYGGVNDRCALLGFKAAAAYFETYDKLPTLLEQGCSFHPESLVAAALDHGGCDVSQTLDAEFGFKRMNGEFEPMQVSAGEIARHASKHSNFY